MNSKQKIILLIGVVLILAGVGYWQLIGGEILSKDGVWIEKEQTDLDKLLGLDPEMEFKEKFIVGLIPHTLGFAGIVVIITAVMFFILRTKKNKGEK
jgi:hypothetical protein